MLNNIFFITIQKLLTKFSADKQPEKGLLMAMHYIKGWMTTVDVVDKIPINAVKPLVQELQKLSTSFEAAAKYTDPDKLINPETNNIITQDLALALITIEHLLYVVAHATPKTCPIALTLADLNSIETTLNKSKTFCKTALADNGNTDPFSSNSYPGLLSKLSNLTYSYMPEAKRKDIPVLLPSFWKKFETLEPLADFDIPQDYDLLHPATLVVLPAFSTSAEMVSYTIIQETTDVNSEFYRLSYKAVENKTPINFRRKMHGITAFRFL